MSQATTPDALASRGAFIRARLGSFLAVFPLGVWTLIHLWNNLAAWKGAEAWQTAVTEYPHPLSQFITAVLVLLPLLLHTIWGIGRLWTANPNNHRYTNFANLKFLLQRVSAVGLLLFIGAHLYLAMLQPRLGIGEPAEHGHPEEFRHIAEQMHHHRPTTLVYLLGTLAVSYHLAHGVHTFCMGWGVVSSQRALKKLSSAVFTLFVVLLTMSWAAIYALYQAGA